MIEIAWKGSAATAASPLLAIVGKGVAFDTGGLDIKPSAGMRLMKKDMGGAAHALALARMVMGADLPARLVVLVPAVENAISGDAMRPGDVLDSRAGLTIEVGNTDAEGRLILADALTRAGELEPDLTLDFATLTGAARVALGPEVIPFYTPDDALAGALASAAANACDPLWRMPLWAGLCGVRRERHRRPEKRPRRLGAGGIGDGGPVPAKVRPNHGKLGAFRRLRVESQRTPRPAGRRRGAGDPRLF